MKKKKKNTSLRSCRIAYDTMRYLFQSLLNRLYLVFSTQFYVLHSFYRFEIHRGVCREREKNNCPLIEMSLFSFTVATLVDDDNRHACNRCVHVLTHCISVLIFTQPNSSWLEIGLQIIQNVLFLHINAFFSTGRTAGIHCWGVFVMLIAHGIYIHLSC